MFYAAATAKSLQSCPTLCDSVDGSPPGSPVPGILQARTLEWVAIGGFKSFITILGFPGGASGKEPAITDLGEKSNLYIRSTMNQESTCFHLKHSDNNLLSEKEHTHTHTHTHYIYVTESLCCIPDTNMTL